MSQPLATRCPQLITSGLELGGTAQCDCGASALLVLRCLDPCCTHSELISFLTCEVACLPWPSTMLTIPMQARCSLLHSSWPTRNRPLLCCLMLCSGEWQAGYMHGVGSFEAPDGSRYSGGWRKDVKHGLGRKVSRRPLGLSNTHMQLKNSTLGSCIVQQMCFTRLEACVPFCC